MGRHWKQYPSLEKRWAAWPFSFVSDSIMRLLCHHGQLIAIRRSWTESCHWWMAVLHWPRWCAKETPLFAEYHWPDLAHEHSKQELVLQIFWLGLRPWGQHGRIAWGGMKSSTWSHNLSFFDYIIDHINCNTLVKASTGKAKNNFWLQGLSVVYILSGAGLLPAGGSSDHKSKELFLFHLYSPLYFIWTMW